jgi:hypothetical protein
MKSFKMYTGDEGVETKAEAGQKNAVVGALVTLILLGAYGWYYWGGGLQQQATNNLDQAKQQVASDAVQQYQIAKAGGSKVEICVQAGLVTAAYLQAQDSANYQQWEQIKNADCAAAGLPNQ